MCTAQIIRVSSLSLNKKASFMDKEMRDGLWPRSWSESVSLSAILLSTILQEGCIWPYSYEKPDGNQMGCICSYFHALTQEMINLVGFKEKLNATSSKCSTTGDINEFRYFLTGILHLFYGKGEEGKGILPRLKYFPLHPLLIENSGRATTRTWLRPFYSENHLEVVWNTLK